MPGEGGIWPVPASEVKTCGIRSAAPVQNRARVLLLFPRKVVRENSNGSSRTFWQSALRRAELRLQSAGTAPLLHAVVPGAQLRSRGMEDETFHRSKPSARRRAQAAPGRQAAADHPVPLSQHTRRARSLRAPKPRTDAPTMQSWAQTPRCRRSARVARAGSASGLLQKRSPARGLLPGALMFGSLEVSVKAAFACRAALLGVGKVLLRAPRYGERPALPQPPALPADPRLTWALQRRGEGQQGQQHPESGGRHGSAGPQPCRPPLRLRAGVSPSGEAGSAPCSLSPRRRVFENAQLIWRSASPAASSFRLGGRERNPPSHPRPCRLPRGPPVPRRAPGRAAAGSGVQQESGAEDAAGARSSENRGGPSEMGRSVPGGPEARRWCGVGFHHQGTGAPEVPGVPSHPAARRVCPAGDGHADGCRVPAARAARPPFAPLPRGSELSPANPRPAPRQGPLPPRQSASACELPRTNALLAGFGSPQYSTPLGKRGREQRVGLGDGRQNFAQHPATRRCPAQAAAPFPPCPNVTSSGKGNGPLSGGEPPPDPHSL